MSAFEEAITLKPLGAGHWTAVADPRYYGLHSMYGGWTAAIALRAVMDTPGRTGTPSAFTMNFINAIEAGTDVQITTTRVGGSRSVQHWHTLVLSADGSVTLAHSISVFASRRDSDGRTEPSMPEAPDPDALDTFHPPGNQGEHIVMRPINGHPPFGRADTRSAAWTRDATGRPLDHMQLALLADAYAPRPLFWSSGERMSATLSMSVYFVGTAGEIAAVGDDYILIEATGTRGAQATSGQQARMWSRRGELLATTEQLCWYR